MTNFCPVEFYLRHLLARQSHDTSQRFTDIKQRADFRSATATEHDQRDQSSDVVGNLGEGIPNSKLVLLPNERHSYFFSNPDQAHQTIREFIKE